jgi:hypothetical protein
MLPFPAQEQPFSGKEREMSPEPDFGETSCRDSGNPEGKMTLITGANSAIGRVAAQAFAGKEPDILMPCLIMRIRTPGNLPAR